MRTPAKKKALRPDAPIWLFAVPWMLTDAPALAAAHVIEPVEAKAARRKRLRPRKPPRA